MDKQVLPDTNQQTCGRVSSGTTAADALGRGASERRLHPRYPVVIDVCSRMGVRSVITKSRDLSEGGVFVHTCSPLQIGTPVSLTLYLPDTGEIDIGGVIAHRLVGLGMGIQFLHFQSGDETRLRDFILGLAEEPVGTTAAASGGQVRPINRRAHERVCLTTAIRVRSASNFYAGLTGDISAGGVFVATTALVPIGTPIDLEFSLPDDGTPIRVAGEVRWTRASQMEGGPPGMGVRFIDLPADEADRIEAFVRGRDTILFDAD